MLDATTHESKLGRLARGPIVTVFMPLLLALVIFLVAYSVAAELPVLGDGTYHVFIMDQIKDSGTAQTDVKVPYPLFYHVFGAIVDLSFGVSGIKVISPAMMALSGLLVYFVALRLTGSKFVGLSAMFLIAFSANLIHRDVQIYMEPVVIFFILCAVYAALLLSRKRSAAALVFASLCIGMAISTKQHAMFLVIAIPIFLLLNGVPLRRVGVLVCIIALFALGPYLALWHSIGGFEQPYSAGSIFDPVPAPAPSSSLLDKMGLGVVSDSVPDWSKELDEESDSAELYKKGTSRQESHHLYFWDMVNPVGFLDLNSLHPLESLSGGFGGFVNVLLRFQGFVLLQILLLASFLFALGYSVTRRSWRIIPAVVFLGWMFTYWGTDTRRYFLFLPVLLAFLYAWPLALAAQNFKLSKHRVVSFLMILGIGACILYAVQGGLEELREQRKLDMKQCYRPSVGGIASMKDVGEWIRMNTAEDDKVFGTSIYEWTYYTDREVWQDYRLYFLEKDRIDYYLSQVVDIKYVLVRDNQVIEPWKHVEWFPESFRDKIAEMYPVAYVSTYGDITVYRVVQQA